MSVNTYNCKNVMVTIGDERVKGYAEDSFISIDPLGEGITSKTGCDGEVIRAVDQNRQLRIKLVLQMFSPTNDTLKAAYDKDREDGSGAFPISVKYLNGETIVDTVAAWVANRPARTFGKDATNIEWTIDTASAKFNVK